MRSAFLYRFASLLSTLLAVVAILSGCDCGKKACSSDAVCSKGEICLLDVCLTGCRESTECEGGKFCVEYRCVTEECKAGVARSCFSGPADAFGIGLCQGGIQYCQADGRWSTCSGEVIPQAESCDRLDNDCNGKIDDLADGKTCSCPSPGTKRECFPGPTSLVGKGTCRAGLQYCEDDNTWGPCLGFVLPEPEICDGKDNDCDGLIDEQIPCGCKEGETRSCYSGPPGTLDVGICKRGMQTCGSNMWGRCIGEQTPKTEICGDSKDNDCNGLNGEGSLSAPCINEPAKEPATEPAKEPNTEPAREVPEAKAEPVFDAGPDARPGPDAGPDTAPDASPVPDLPPDTRPDTGAPDPAPDTQSEPTPPDMAPDAGPDTAPDAPVDAGPDTAPDSSTGEPPLEPPLDGGSPGPDEPFWGPDEPSGGADAGTDGVPGDGSVVPDNDSGADHLPDAGVAPVCQTGTLRVCSYDLVPQTLSVSCTQHLQTCSNGVWGTCMPISSKVLSSSTVETCNGQDDDCNGLIDDGLTACGTSASLCANGLPCVTTFAGPQPLLHTLKKGALYPLFGKISGAAFDVSNNRLYLADAGRHQIWALSTAYNAGNMTYSTTVALFAGDGLPGFKDAQGSAARFHQPHGLVMDRSSNVYVADTGNHCIRKITSGGRVTTAAGQCGTSGDIDNASLTASRFSGPKGLAYFNDILYVADTDNHRIRSVDLNAASQGVLTVVGNTDGYVDGTKNMALFSFPADVEVDISGSLFVADTGNHLVRTVDVFSNIVSTIAGNCSSQTICNQGFQVGTQSQSLLRKPQALALNGSTLYVADFGNHAILSIDLSQSHKSAVLAGALPSSGQGVAGVADGIGTAARFDSPAAMALDSSGFLFVGDQGNQRVRVIRSTNQAVTAIAGSSVSGAAAGKPEDSTFLMPSGIVYDSANGTVYVADTGNHVIRAVSASGVSVVVGTPGQAGTGQNDLNMPRGLALSGNQLYIADAGNNRIQVYDTQSKSMTPITNFSLKNPHGLALDGSGMLLFVADTGNHRVYTYDLMANGPKGSVGMGLCDMLSLKEPKGVAVSPSGILYVADTGNDRICSIPVNQIATSTPLVVLPLAPISVAQPLSLLGPVGIAVDGSNHIYIANERSHRIHKVDSTGKEIWSFHRTEQGHRDGGPDNALFHQPGAIAIYQSGRILVTDVGNHRIRIIEQ